MLFSWFLGRPAAPAPSSARRTVLHVLDLESRDAPAADLRVVSYNVTADNSAGTIRPGMVDILRAIGDQQLPGGIPARPIDILAVQEVRSATMATLLNLMNSLDPDPELEYARGTLSGGTSGGGTQGVIYRTSSVQLVGEIGVGTVSTSGAARQTVRHQLRPVGAAANAGEDLYVYNSHWKASDTSGDRARRNVEAQAIRANADALPAAAQVLYVGDFNVYGSTEAGYRTLVQTAGNGLAVDVANPAENWARESNTFRTLLTQAPLNSPASGLSGGGLDDRFDFILMSEELNNGTGLDYKAGSYRTFGNNGTTAVNGNTNAAGNTSLANTGLTPAQQQDVLNKLTTVTDHLPVVADFTLPTVQLTAATLTAAESAGATAFTVTRTPAGTPVTVTATLGGSAVNGVDYTVGSTTLTFAANETTKTIPLTLLDDDRNEPDKTVTVSLSVPTGTPAAPVGVLLAAPSTGTLTITDDDALRVTGFKVDAGAAQRSRVTSVAFTFNGVVTAAGFTVAGFPGTVTPTAVTAAGRTTVTLTFSGAGTEFGSLADGRYTASAAGVAGLTGQAGYEFHRLFGDADGDADVDMTDYSRFRQASGAVAGRRPEFDFNADGVISAADEAQVRRRLGRRV